MHHQHNQHHHGFRFARHGFGFGGGGPRGFGRHGRPERVFEQGDLRLVLLKLIADEPRHGYQLIKAVEDAVGGAYSPSPGVVYPTLTLLEELGYATAREEGGKKLFSITPEGQAHLDSQAPAVTQLFERMAGVAADNRGGRAPQVVRAMENLRMAMRMRLGGGPMTEEQVQAVAAVLDEAARKIEQV